MLLAVIIFIITIIMVIISIRKKITDGQFELNSNYFRQAGVKIYFKTSMIELGKKTFDVNQVKTIRWETVGSSLSSSLKIYIGLEDINYPMHTIIISGEKMGLQFIQRFSTALRKAGGPSFN